MTGFERIKPVIVLSENFRIRITALQWVIEKRDGAGKPQWNRLQRPTEVWRPFAYCRSRAGLETALSRIRSDYGEYLDRTPIASFPAWFPEIEGEAPPPEDAPQEP